MNQSDRSQVLNKHGINSSGCKLSNVLFELCELVGEDKRVERYIAKNTPPMQQTHKLRKPLKRKIHSPSPSIEASVQTKINGVSTIFDRRMNAFPISCRGQQLGRWPRGGRVVRHLKNLSKN
jgi:hypothetical protein